MRSNARFTRGDFFRRLWLFIPLVRRILPVAVILNRFLAPLCVFSFCFVTTLCPFLLALTHFLLNRIDEHRHRAPFHAGRLFNQSMRPQLLGQLIEEAASNVGMRHLSTTEENRQLDFVTAIKEPGGLATLRFKIVIVDLGPNSHLFEFNDVLVLPRFPLFAALLVPELAVIHEPADWRNRIWRDLNQVKTPVACHLQRFKCRDHPNLGAFLINQPDFTNPDSLIDAGLDWSGNSLPPTRCSGDNTMMLSTIKRRYTTGAIALN